MVILKKNNHMSKLLIYHSLPIIQPFYPLQAIPIYCLSAVNPVVLGLAGEESEGGVTQLCSN